MGNKCWPASNDHVPKMNLKMMHALQQLTKVPLTAPSKLSHLGEQGQQEHGNANCNFPSEPWLGKNVVISSLLLSQNPETTFLSALWMYLHQLVCRWLDHDHLLGKCWSCWPGSFLINDIPIVFHCVWMDWVERDQKKEHETTAHFFVHHCATIFMLHILGEFWIRWVGDYQWCHPWSIVNTEHLWV